MKSNISDEVLNAIKQFFTFKFERGTVEDKSNVFFMTTAEVAEKVRKIYPSAEITDMLVAEIMTELKFEFTDTGNLDLEWILKPAD